MNARCRMIPPTLFAAAVLAVALPGPAVAAAPADPSMLAQDRMAIEETLRRYVRGLDDADLEGYLATLTDDAKFVADARIAVTAITAMHTSRQAGQSRVFATRKPR
jgi:hypothetical protein